MTDRLKSAFDKIQVEEQLKETTLKRIYRQEANKDGFFRRFKIKKAATVFACFVPLVLVGFLSYNTYFTESAYVDLDINPSVELSINRFDRVISANAYNEDGEDLLAELDIANEKIDTAIPKIIEATADKGQLQKEGLVSVTVQTKAQNEKSLLDHIKSIVDSVLLSYKDTESDIFTVDSEVKTASHDEHLTPAKYLAILELQEVDETATIEGCRHHSISNIKKQTKEHSRKHNNSGDDGSGSKNHDSDSNSNSHSESKKNSTHNDNSNSSTHNEKKKSGSSSSSSSGTGNSSGHSGSDNTGSDNAGSSGHHGSDSGEKHNGGSEH